MQAMSACYRFFTIIDQFSEVWNHGSNAKISGDRSDAFILIDRFTDAMRASDVCWK
jgi:hypothetical protein